MQYLSSEKESNDDLQSEEYEQTGQENLQSRLHRKENAEGQCRAIDQPRIRSTREMASNSRNILIMDASIKSILLLATVILTGLSAGFFLAWQISVIPGTKRVLDSTYLETMQSINRAILNPAFFFIFFGTLLVSGVASVYEFQSSKLVFGLTLASAISYALGTFGVTAAGNVPLNNELDVLDIGRITSEKVAEFRLYYESNWNRLHLIRTVFAVLSFLFSVLALFVRVR